MKQCPFCETAIEENARFCLYCMSPLTEKVPVGHTKRKSKRWWVILAAVFVLSVFVTVLLLPPRPAPKNEEFPAAATTATTTRMATTTAENPVSAVATTNGTTTTNPTPTTPATSSTTTTTTTVPTTTTYSTTSTTSSTSVTVGTTTTTVPQETVTTESLTWYYRAATAADYDAAQNGVAMADAIVVIGFDRIPQNGVYVVPATIDGKTVVGMDMTQARGLAFDSSSVRRTVKALYLPPAVTTLADDLLAECIYLSDLYVAGSELYLTPSALPSSAARLQPLTLHTPLTCWCSFANTYFVNYCTTGDNDYRVAHQTWEPDTVYTEGLS